MEYEEENILLEKQEQNRDNLFLDYDKYDPQRLYVNDHRLKVGGLQIT